MVVAALAPLLLFFSSHQWLHFLSKLGENGKDQVRRNVLKKNDLVVYAL